jgi:hypothetical protein
MLRARNALRYVNVVATVAFVLAFGGTAIAAEPAPSFKIEMLQRIRGSEQALPGQGFTRSPLTAKLGDTVEYEAIITNTGNVPLNFGFNDPDCEQIAFFPESDPIAPGDNVVRTCSHVLTSVGVWTNEASTGAAEFSGPTRLGAMVSNKVSVEVPPEPGLAVETIQEINGAGTGYTAWPLSGTVGQTVDYEVIVKNTGNVAVTLAEFRDPHCDFGTFAGPSRSVALPPQEVVTYHCSHMLVEGDLPQLSNTAIVTWESSYGPPASATSTVLTGVAAGVATGVAESAVCSIPEPSIVLHGAGGHRRAPFKVWITSSGIAQITFYLDGHKLKTLKTAQAKKGDFSVTINPGKLSYKAHKVSVTAVMGDTRCARIVRSGVFVRPRPAAVSSSVSRAPKAARLPGAPKVSVRLRKA